jgi:hypothetical protein
MAEKMVKAFRCSRTGMMYPEDYVEQWGRKYGVGMGSTPISEALCNHYHDPVAEGKGSDSTMHPVGLCRSQVDLVMVPESEYLANQAIVHNDDPDYLERSKIMRDKQLAKSGHMQSRFPHEVEKAKARIEERKTGSKSA